MKILVNKLSDYTVSKEVESKYPRKYTCQICFSELEIDQADVKNIDVPLFNSSATVKGLGFNCPVCNELNITG